MSSPHRSSQNERQKFVAGSFRERTRRLHCSIIACDAPRGTQWLLPIEPLKARRSHQSGGCPPRDCDHQRLTGRGILFADAIDVRAARGRYDAVNLLLGVSALLVMPRLVSGYGSRGKVSHSPYRSATLDMLRSCRQYSSHCWSCRIL